MVVDLVQLVASVVVGLYQDATESRRGLLAGPILGPFSGVQKRINFRLLMVLESIDIRFWLWFS